MSTTKAASKIDFDLQGRTINAHILKATKYRDKYNQHSDAAGLLLTEAKKELGHGKWLPWLKTHKIGTSTASRLMRELVNPAEREARKSKDRTRKSTERKANKANAKAQRKAKASPKPDTKSAPKPESNRSESEQSATKRTPREQLIADVQKLVAGLTILKLNSVKDHIEGLS